MAFPGLKYIHTYVQFCYFIAAYAAVYSSPCVNNLT